MIMFTLNDIKESENTCKFIRVGKQLHLLVQIFDMQIAHSKQVFHLDTALTGHTQLKENMGAATRIKNFFYYGEIFQ